MPRVQVQTTKQVPLPAPEGGINAVSAATSMPDTDALMLVNMIAGRLGVTSRLGYDVHTATGLSGEVRTIIPYSAGVTTGDRLFVTTSTGIYDASAPSLAPILKATFGTNNADSGWGVFTTFVTSAGHYCFYADEANGLHRSAGSTWAAVSDITFSDGTTPADIVFVTVWKNRVWMVKRNTGDAYFLDVGLIAGAAQRHSFGNKFRAGGYLVGLWSWTRDGGAGVDDYLVAISSAGDVMVYRGTDPTNASAFEETGSWFVGAVPSGRRIATDFGGDLAVLSMLGVVLMSKLIIGTLNPGDQTTTQKIQPLFNSYAASRGGLRGWSLRLHPADNALLINMPVLGSRYEQFAMSLANGTWSLLRGLPSLSSELWRGQLYFGTPDGRVCVARGGTDNGSPVEWYGQTSFQTAGSARRKRVHMIEPLVLTQGARPGVEVQARYDFASDAISVQPAAPDNSAAATWGVAHWDATVWPGSDVPVYGLWRGATGNGHYVSVAFRGRSSARATLMGFNVRYDEGGVL